MGIFSHYVHMLPAPLVPAGIFPGFCLAPPPNTSKNQTHSKASMRGRGTKGPAKCFDLCRGSPGIQPRESWEGVGGLAKCILSRLVTPFMRLSIQGRVRAQGSQPHRGKFNFSILYDVGFKITNH